MKKWKEASGRNPDPARKEGPVPQRERPAKRPPHDEEKKLKPPDKRGAS